MNEGSKAKNESNDGYEGINPADYLSGTNQANEEILIESDNDEVELLPQRSSPRNKISNKRKATSSSEENNFSKESTDIANMRIQDLLSKSAKIKNKHPNYHAAVLDVVENKMSMRKATLKHNVVRSTLYRSVLKYKNLMKNDEGGTSVFSQDEEDMLLRCLKRCNQQLDRLTQFQLRKLAYEFAKQNNIVYPSDWDTYAKASVEWAEDFMTRYSSELLVHSSEPTTIAKVISMKRDIVNQFFLNYQAFISAHDVPPSCIYSMEETKISSRFNPPKVIVPSSGEVLSHRTTLGGRHSMASATVTMLATANAVGECVPPFFIFPQTLFSKEFLAGAPPGSIGTGAASGYMNDDTFKLFIKHFIRHVQPSRDKRVVLLVNTAEEYHESREVTDLAEEHGVEIMSLPSQTNHKLEPLHQAVFGEFKTIYYRCMVQWKMMTGNQRREVSLSDVATLAGKAYPEVFTPNNIMRGFAVTGLHPINYLVLQDEITPECTIEVLESNQEAPEESNDFSSFSLFPISSLSMPSTSRIP